MARCLPFQFSIDMTCDFHISTTDFHVICPRTIRYILYIMRTNCPFISFFIIDSPLLTRFMQVILSILLLNYISLASIFFCSSAMRLSSLHCHTTVLMLHNISSVSDNLFLFHSILCSFWNTTSLIQFLIEFWFRIF